MNNDGVHHRVSSAASPPLCEVITLHRLRLGHVLRVPAHRLPFLAHFAPVWLGWKKRSGNQTITRIIHIYIYIVP